MNRAEILDRIARQDWTRDWQRELELLDEIDRNDRILKLAEHNRYPIETRTDALGRRLFYPPVQLREIAGAAALVVR